MNGLAKSAILAVLVATLGCNPKEIAPNGLQGARGSYPIAGMTWAVVYVNQPPGKGKQLVEFLTWALSDEGHVGQLLYCQLPEKLAARARHKVKEIHVSK